MRDEAAAQAVIERFPDLPISDPHGAAIFAAVKIALDTKAKHGQNHSARASLILLKNSLDNETAKETSEIFENVVSKEPPTKDARRVALRAAQVLHRLENPVFALTDAGNGERLAFHYYSEAVYCIEWKKWLLWSGQRWEMDTRNAIFVLAKETARRIPAEAKSAKGEDYGATLKWAIKSEAKERLNAMLFLGSTEDGMSVETREVDQNKWLFNVQNGTLNLKTGQLKPHDRADLLTKISPVHFDPHATCPLFLEFLHKIFQGRQNLIRFMQRVIGYSLTGETREQIFLVLFGAGSNGKSLLLKILRALFADYGHTMEAKTIYAKREDRMPSDVAELAGKRFVACSEANEGRRLDEATVKQITGGDEMTGERKYENQFSFTPQFQLFFATNHKPEIRGTDHAIWRRVQLVPFDVKFWDAEKGEKGPPELQADPALFDKLRAEMPGVLAWAVQGCLDWQRDGLGTPDEILNATRGYREEQDRLGAFFSERCVVTPTAIAKSSDLYAAYSVWADDNGEVKMTQTAMGKQLKERGFIKTLQAGTGKAVWRGVGCRSVESEV
jgi:putative DNA primase/helicase